MVLISVNFNESLIILEKAQPLTWRHICKKLLAKSMLGQLYTWGLSWGGAEEWGEESSAWRRGALGADLVPFPCHWWLLLKPTTKGCCWISFISCQIQPVVSAEVVEISILLINSWRACLDETWNEQIFHFSWEGGSRFSVWHCQLCQGCCPWGCTAISYSWEA